VIVHHTPWPPPDFRTMYPTSTRGGALHKPAPIASRHPTLATVGQAKHDTSHIIQSLASNVALAAVKFVAAFYTGSGALLAEALHTTTDSLNQILLLIGVRASRRGPDRRHPLGYGRELYFWSFLVALLLFTAGGMFSIYEGVHKFSTPSPIEHAWLGFSIFAISVTLEVFVTRANMKQIDQKRGERGFLQFVRDSKESDLIVVFGENAAALLGSILALGAFALSWKTGNGRWDAVGSILVGVVLIGVAVFLTIEVKSLLIGESADPEISAAVAQAASEVPLVDDIRELITVQQGPGEVLVALKVTCPPTLDAKALSQTINEFEAHVRMRCPQVRWIFVEPDLGGVPSRRIPPVDRASMSAKDEPGRP
jgi:cation diffusion facilitator family transporter